MNQRDFEKYYNMFFDDLFRYVLTIVKNEEDTKDILQETFIKLFKSNDVFASDQHVKSWLLKVSRNASTNIFRHWYTNKRIEVTDFSSFQSDLNDDHKVLQEVFDLPLKYRQVIYLHYYEGYSIKEVSNLLNKNESTIKTQLSRARERLKGVLNNE
ncbi:MAG TPA: RNA polymerase sigma factor [Erysipelothrix sp.]|nr:RNA polymerase sigma factor [Erysipelothrix sp.]